MPTDWEAKYREGDTPWDKGAASPGLVEFLAVNTDLPRGRVLVPGCGAGHDVKAWAQAGFEAHGLDLAPSAIRRCDDATREMSVSAVFRCGDFLRDVPDNPFDWLFEHTLYCAIDPADRAAYEEAVHRWLRPGGSFIAVHYLIPNTEGPPFGTTREEVVTRFSARLELVSDWVPRSYPNREGRERMFWWRKPL